MVASFGPPVPVDGIAGDLYLADPPEGCTPLTPPDLPSGDARWIALIARSHARSDECTFDVKVRHAEAAGAVAAVVYDDMFEGLLVMAAPAGNLEPGIPSVFVSQASGALMRQMLAPGQTKAFISPSPSLLWASMFMSAFAGCLAVSVVSSAFYLARRPPAGLTDEDGGDDTPPPPPRRRRNPTLPPEQLSLLPVLVHGEGGEGGSSASGSDAEDDGPARPSASAAATPPRPAAGDTKRLCAICLDAYAPGDKLRLLPCQHRYHRECIDPWLSDNSRACPVCKADAGAALAAAAAAADLEAGEGGSGSGGGRSGDNAALEGAAGVRAAAVAALSALRGRWAAWRGGGEAPEEAQRRLLPLAEGPARAPSEAPGPNPPVAGAV